MVSSSQLKASKEIQRTTGRTFYLATRFLPRRIREPTYVLYGFFRLADQVVDDPDPPPADDQKQQLDRIRKQVLGNEHTTNPILQALNTIRLRHGIPDKEIEAFFDSMGDDIEHSRYETFESLEGYMRGSAVAVAYMMLAIMDPNNQKAKPHARALGEAFQLTNFLRDVAEDSQQFGRIYLPTQTLERHGIAATNIHAGQYSGAFAAAIQEELIRAEQRYRKGVAGIRLLPEDCQFAVLLAAVLYAEHHRLIRNHNFNVLATTPQLTIRQYIPLIIRTWWHWKLSADPEATFYRVSPISPNSTTQMTDSRISKDFSVHIYARSVGVMRRIIRSKWFPHRTE